MKIISWNVAGIRALLKKEHFYNFIYEIDPDIICFQETKAFEKDVIFSKEFMNIYKYRYWNSNKGEVQRKGLNGIAIFSKLEPTMIYPIPEFDNEGRILSLGFKINNIEFILVSTYVPNSQKLGNVRYHFRNEWNNKFNNYVLNLGKNVIICGDMNVAHNDNDICNPRQKYNKIAGFFNCERQNMTEMLNLGFKDVFRTLNPLEKSSTYWSNFLKQERSNENGWRLDYFLIRTELLNFLEINKLNYKYNCFKEIKGSDHCPIIFCIE